MTRLGAALLAVGGGFLSPAAVFAQGATLTYTLFQTFEGHAGRVQTAVFSPDGALLATGDDQGTIKLWDIGQERELKTVKAGTVTALAFSADHKLLISGHADRTVKVWSTETGALLKTLQGHRGAVYAVAVSPDGQMVASGGDDRSIRLWGAKLGNEMGTLDGHEGRVVSLAFSRDGRMVMSGSDDKTLRLWDPTKRKEIRNITESGGKFGTLHAAAFSPDLQVIAVAMTEVKKDTGNRRSMSGPPIWDKVIKVRNGTGEELVTLRGHLQDVKTVTVSADGRFIASGSPDQTVRLWDVARGTEITTIAQKAAVTAVAFSPDGRWLAAGGDDKKVFVWKTTGVAPPAEVARLQTPGAVGPVTREPVEVFPPVDVDFVPATKMPQKKNAYVIAIGIETYQNLTAKVDYAARDAETMKEYLVNAMGYPEENVRLVKNEQATRSTFQKYFETWLPKNVEKDGEVFIYYAGHGSPKPKSTEAYEAYLIPYDGDPAFLDDTAYPLQRLYQSLAKLPTKNVVVVLDSCFSGAGGRSVIAKGTRFMALTVEDPLLAPQGMTVFAAASGNQVSSYYPEKRHGLFTYFFLKGLQGEADANHDGIVDMAEIFAYVQPNVAKTARKTNNVEQTPQLIPSLDLLGARARTALIQLAK